MAPGTCGFVAVWWREVADQADHRPQMSRLALTHERVVPRAAVARRGFTPASGEGLQLAENRGEELGDRGVHRQRITEHLVWRIGRDHRANDLHDLIGS